MAVLRSCGQFSRLISVLKVRIIPSEPLNPKFGHARGRRWGRRGKERQLMLPPDLTSSDIADEPQVHEHESLLIDPDEGENSQSIDDFYNTLSDRGPTVSQLQRFAKQEREKLKLKILKRKYFKDPQEMNLLTWETKEQIRFLHREFPEEWTIEKLAASFPVSEDSIIKMLKSSYVIMTREKMLEHDLKVKKRWRQLEAELTRGAEGGGGPINPQYKLLIESGKLDLMKNAATLKGAPKEVLRLRNGTKTGNEGIGIFSSILKDHNLDNTKLRERKGDEPLTVSNAPQLNKLLEAIDAQQKINPVSGSPGERTSTEDIVRASMHEILAVKSDEIPQSMRRRQKEKEVSIKNMSYLEAYQMMGTGKVVNNEGDNIEKKVTENGFTERENRRYFRHSVQQYPSPAPNEPSLNETRQQQQTWDSSFQTKIEIPHHLNHKKNVIYKKNDTYYDENGEILYRVSIKE